MRRRARTVRICAGAIREDRPYRDRDRRNLLAHGGFALWRFTVIPETIQSIDFGVSGAGLPHGTEPSSPRRPGVPRYMRSTDHKTDTEMAKPVKAD
jgi:hypothetical protein